MLEVNWKFKPIIQLIDLIGYTFLRPFLRKDLPKKVKKILVIRVDEIGDAILSIPVFRALRQKFPESEISVLIKPLNKSVYENNPNIDRMILTNSWLNTWSDQKISFIGYLKLIRKLRKEDFDLAVELHTDPRNILLASLTSKFCIGYGYRGFGFLLNKKAQKKSRHIIGQCLDVVRLVDADSTSDLDISLSKEPVKSIRQKMKEEGFNLTKPQKLICMAPGAGRKNKQWLVSSWVYLILEFLKDKNLYIVLTGTQEESKDVEGILSLLKDSSKRILNLCGKTSISELFALISHCNLVIAPDSAVIHVANALDVPSIGIYGPTNPGIWGYNSTFHKSIFCKLDCSFCNKAVCRLKSGKHKCMEWISPKDVFREVETFI